MLIMMLIHKGVPNNYIKKSLRLSDDKFKTIVKILEENNLVYYKDEICTLKCMAITYEESKKLYSDIKILAEKTANIFINKLSQIKKKTFEIESFRNIDFNELSFFIFSDVLLDSVQIDRVEEKFLKSERPLRNGKHFYLTLFEKNIEDPEIAFGIYGNMNLNLEDFSFSIYTNNQMGTNYITLSKEELEEYFQLKCENDLLETKKKLLNELINVATISSYTISENFKKGFNKLGLMKDNKVIIPVFTKSQYNQLESIADLILQDLLDIFENNKKLLEDIYKNSPYYNESSFNEYFIYLYHFYYTLVTNILIEKGVVQLPENKVFSYIELY